MNSIADTTTKRVNGLRTILKKKNIKNQYIIAIDTHGYNDFKELATQAIESGVRIIVGPIYTSSFRKIATDIAENAERESFKKKLRKTVFISPISSGKIESDFEGLENKLTYIRLYATTRRSAQFIRDNMDKVSKLDRTLKKTLFYEDSQYGNTYKNEMSSIPNLTFVSYSPSINKQTFKIRMNNLYSSVSPGETVIAVALGERAKEMIINKPNGVKLMVLDAAYFEEMEDPVKSLSPAEQENVFFVGYLGSPYEDRKRRIRFIEEVYDRFALIPSVETMLSYDAMDVAKSLYNISRTKYPPPTPATYKSSLDNLEGSQTLTGNVEFTNDGEREKGKFVIVQYKALHNTVTYNDGQETMTIHDTFRRVWRDEEYVKNNPSNTNHTWLETVVGDYDQDSSIERESSTTDFNLTVGSDTVSSSQGLRTGKRANVYVRNIHGVTRNTVLNEGDTIQGTIPATSSIELYNYDISKSFYSEKPLIHDAGYFYPYLDTIVFPTFMGPHEKLIQAEEITIMIPNLDENLFFWSFTNSSFVDSAVSHPNPKYAMLTFLPRQVAVLSNEQRNLSGMDVRKEPSLHIGLKRLFDWIKTYMSNLKKATLVVRGTGQLLMNSYKHPIDLGSNVDLKVHYLDVPKKWYFGDQIVRSIGSKTYNARKLGIDTIKKLHIEKRINLLNLRLILDINSPMYTYNNMSFGENSIYAPSSFRSLFENLYVNKNGSPQTRTRWELVPVRSSLGKLITNLSIKSSLIPILEIFNMNHIGPKKNFYDFSKKINIDSHVPINGNYVHWMYSKVKNNQISKEHQHILDNMNISVLIDPKLLRWDITKKQYFSGESSPTAEFFNVLYYSRLNPDGVTYHHPVNWKRNNDTGLTKYQKLDPNDFQAQNFNAYYTVISQHGKYFTVTKGLKVKMLIEKDVSSGEDEFDFLVLDRRAIMDTLFEIPPSAKKPVIYQSSSIGPNSHISIMSRTKEESGELKSTGKPMTQKLNITLSSSKSVKSSQTQNAVATSTIDTSDIVSAQYSLSYKQPMNQHL